MRAVFFLLVLVTVAAFTIDEASAQRRAPQGGWGNIQIPEGGWAMKHGQGHKFAAPATTTRAPTTTTPGTGDEVTGN
jgi:hypothetical protein